MPIIPKRNENNMTGFGTLPQALDVNMPNPQISGVQPVGGQNYLVKPLENLMNMAIKAQEDADNVVLLDTHNQFNAFTMGVESDFMRDKKGKNALDIKEPLKQAIDKVTELTKPLNKKVAEKFRIQADNNLINFNKRLRDYSNRESEEYTKSVFDVSYQQGIEQVKANYLDNEAIRDIAGNLFSIIGTRAEQEGWADNVTADAIFKTWDDIHSGVILKKIEKNDDIGALQYYKDNERDISEKQKSFLREKLKISTTEGESRRIVNDVISQYPDFNEPYEAVQLINKLSKENEDVRKNATSLYENSYNLYYKQKSNQNDKMLEELYGIMANTEVPFTETDLKNHPAYSLLTENKQLEIVNKLKASLMADKKVERDEKAITEAFNISEKFPNDIKKQYKETEKFLQSDPLLFKAIRSELGAKYNDGKQIEAFKQESAYGKAEKILKANGEKFGYSKDLYVLVPEEYTSPLISANLSRLKQSQYILNHKERDNQAATLESYLDQDNFKKLLTGEASINRLFASKSLSLEGKNILAALLKEYDPKKVSALQSALKIPNSRTMLEYMPDATDMERIVEQEKIKNQIYNETLYAIAKRDEEYDPIKRAEELLKPVQKGYMDKLINMFKKTAETNQTPSKEKNREPTFQQLQEKAIEKRGIETENQKAIDEELKKNGLPITNSNREVMKKELLRLGRIKENAE